MSENPSMQIKCRKCGGPHFTIKCGKEIKPNNILNSINYDEDNTNYSKKNSNIENNKKYNKKTYTVKISELPYDITEKELMELTYDWGNIIKIKVLNYQENSAAYIDFKYEEQANYFVKALHKTIFEYLLINVMRVD